MKDLLLNHLALISTLLLLLLIAVIPVVRNLVLQTIFGVVIVPEDSVGLQVKKFVLFGKNKSLPQGKIIALNGEAGYQAKTLPPGIHYGKWNWQYQITMQKDIVINGGRMGVIKAKDGNDLPNGSILAPYRECSNFQDAEAFLNNGGFKGRQTQYLSPGTYKINTLLFEVAEASATTIENDTVGIVTVLVGDALPAGAIAGVAVANHNKFQNADQFLKNNGTKGLQSEVILSGTYYINPWFAKVEGVHMTEVPIGYVGVVNSFFGEEGKDVSGTDFKHGNIVSKGQKGVWNECLQPGKYPINTAIAKVELVPTTNLVLNWADARSEAHKLDANLSTIKVRSKDGFTFNLDVSQIIHVPMEEAPKVIARFGTMQNLVNQVLEPTIGNYFRNSAQDSDVIQFLNDRKKRQDEAKKCISDALKTYNVIGVDTLIGDIVPPADLMRTLTDRKIAEEGNLTYKQQIITEATRQELSKQTALADIQPDMVKAEQGVEIADKKANATVKTATGDMQASKLKAEGEAFKIQAEAEAEAGKITKLGNAEAGKVLAIGKANAESYELQAEAIGQDNLSKLKIMETIAEGKVKLMPEVLIAGGANGNSSPIDALLGFQILKEYKSKGEIDLPESK